MSSIRHFIQIVEQAGRGLIRAYHGTPHQFDAFDPDRAADGHAQEGAGFYFTTDISEAERYATGQGRVLVVDLDVSRELPVTGKVNPKHVEALMRGAPDLEDTLMNWDESPERAFATALRAMLQGDGPKACFENVWYDFYRDAPAEYLRNVAALGYGGTVVPKTGCSHIVMYDLAKVHVVETRPVGLTEGVEPAPTVVADDGDVPHALAAFFGEDGAHLRFWKVKNGSLVIQSMRASKDTRGRDMLRWLKDTYGLSATVVEVTSESRGFWSRMKREGLVDRFVMATGSASPLEKQSVPLEGDTA